MSSYGDYLFYKGQIIGFLIGYFIVGYLIFNFTTSFINKLIWVDVGLFGAVICALLSLPKEKK
jgi:hypothetical protein